MIAHSPRPACPRGHGRLTLAQDRYGAYLSCFLCGYVRELMIGTPLDLPSGSHPT